MLISKWDMEISLDIIQHWFNLMDTDGWISREQILGEEARSKVPPEFHVQFPLHANPPTLFIAVGRLLAGVQGKQREFFQADFAKLYPKMKRNWEWFRETQFGSTKAWPNRSKPAGRDVYRWRGRTNGHTLPSGLDDYPRGEPHVGELHLDLLCWMAMTTETLKKLAVFNQLEEDASEFEEVLENIMENLTGMHSFLPLTNYH